MLLIGYCIAKEPIEYYEDKRVPDSRGEDVNSQGTLLTCWWPKDAGRVILSSKDKQILTQDKFESFSECRSLDLINLGIVDMENAVFSTMGNLQYLTIGDDDIHLRPAMFEGLDLKMISLYNMSINILPDRFFAQHDSLLELLLHKNPLNVINPESFFGLSSLTALKLAYSNVVVTPGLFQHLPELIRLDISHTPFKFTPDMWNNVSLISLRLENAGLSDLSSEIWTGLEGFLKIMSLSGNHFQTITSHSFHGLTKLTNLELNMCGIQHVDAQAFEGTESLEWLFLKHNPIITMDSNMFGSTPLQEQVMIWFDCESMSCFPDLCWIHEKMKETEIVKPWCDTRCDNYNITLEQYLDNEC